MELEEAFSLIREVPDFPSPGILFQDIAPMLAHGDAFSRVTRAFADQLPNGILVAGIEARGFIFASSLAHEKQVGFLPIRKSGKLPGEVYKQEYELEYGTDVIEIQKGSFQPGAKVVLIDDVLATGGTIVGAIKLLQASGAVVTKVLVLLEITALNGKDLIESYFPEIEVVSLAKR